MAVYVDNLFRCPKTAKWPYSTACHMFADTTHELHAAAIRIGLKRAWFQDNPELPHYDLVPGKRFAALKIGAIEVSNQEVAKVIRLNREKIISIQRHLNAQ